MSDDLQRADVPTLVQRYAEAATRHGRASDDGLTDEADAAYDVLTEAYRELRRRGPQAQHALHPLLAHPDAFVRGWAGAHALEFAPEDGEEALRELADSDPRLAGFNARVTLDEWRAGRLRFP